MIIIVSACSGLLVDGRRERFWLQVVLTAILLLVLGWVERLSVLWALGEVPLRGRLCEAREGVFKELGRAILTGVAG